MSVQIHELPSFFHTRGKIHTDCAALEKCRKQFATFYSVSAVLCRKVGGIVELLTFGLLFGRLLQFCRVWWRVPDPCFISQ